MTKSTADSHADLVAIVDTAMASAYERGGDHLACRPGCTQCCHGVFPISQQDAHRLREGLQRLEMADGKKASRIRQRLEASMERISPLYPGDVASGILSAEYEDSPLFADEDSIGDSEACPILDPATGTCDLYEARPIVCRTFGPPMRTADDDLATCELCFVTASQQEIAAAEVDPDVPELEAASNDAFNEEHHVHGETIVVMALARH